MKLVIEKTDKYNLSFVKWLRDEIETELTASINSGELSRIQKYINTQLTDTPINILHVLLMGIKYLSVKEINGYFHITIDEFKMYGNTKFKLLNLCKLINYGNLECKGCYIFSNVFDRITNRIDNYYNLYVNQLGVV